MHTYAFETKKMTLTHLLEVRRIKVCTWESQIPTRLVGIPYSSKLKNCNATL